MRANSHRQFGYFLADRYLPDLPKRHLKAFLTGCTQPDRNPTTYLKGSIRNRLLHGHDYISAKRYLFRLIRILQKRKYWGMIDYYRLGKLFHYLADAFTHAHSNTFSGSLSDHRKYEYALHLHFLKQLKHPHRIFSPMRQDITANISVYHRLYLQTPPSISTDADYIIGTSCLVMEMLTDNIKSDIFSI